MSLTPSDCLLIPYIGSKRRMLNFIGAELPPHSRYIEPFGGGFSLGLSYLASGQAKNPYYNDISPEMFAFWTSVKNNPWKLIERINYFSRFIPELLVSLEDFTGKRASLSLEDLLIYAEDQVDIGALRYLLNYLTQGNSNPTRTITGHVFDTFKVSSVKPENFLRVSHNIQNVDILNCSVLDMGYLDSSTSFWYLDPPYFSESYKGFYTEGDDFDHDTLAKFLKSLDGTFLLSYDDHPYIRELYRDFAMYPILVPSRLSYHHSEELLITNSTFYTFLENSES